MATFDEARAVVQFSQPFFATLLMKMRHVEDPNLNPPTLAVSRSEVRYHPQFVADSTLDELIFGICHEIMHLAWEHLPRMEYYHRSGMGPDGQPLDWDRYNRAADYPINALLVKEKIGEPIKPERMKICLDPKRFPDTMTPEEVYCQLSKDEKGGGSPKGGGQAFDQHDSAGAGEGDPDGITKADIIQAAQQHKAIKGTLPAGMERYLEEMKRPDNSPWARLRRFITKSLPGADASSWRRLQRKMVVRGVGMPGRVSQGAGTVGVVVDTSGSIGQEMLNLFGSHLAAIMADARPERILIYWVDARVHRVDVAKTQSELRQIMSKKVPGGGGTDMPKGVLAAEQDKCDGIVVLTDGYTPFCGSKKPLMWAITDHSITSPHGDTIHI